MLQKTLGIVLHLIPYNDKVAVAHLYTREYGRTSFLFPQGNGRKARMYRPLFMPFSILELDIDYRNTPRDSEDCRGPHRAPPCKTSIPTR